MPKMPSMKPYVGIAKTTPDSRTPRRFMRVITTIAATAHCVLWVSITGYAEARLATAAAMDTATVST